MDLCHHELRPQPTKVGRDEERGRDPMHMGHPRGAAKSVSGVWLMQVPDKLRCRVSPVSNATGRDTDMTNSGRNSGAQCNDRGLNA